MDPTVTIFALDDEAESLSPLSEGTLERTGDEVLPVTDPREALEQRLGVCPKLIRVAV